MQKPGLRFHVSDNIRIGLDAGESESETRTSGRVIEAEETASVGVQAKAQRCGEVCGADGAQDPLFVPQYVPTPMYFLPQPYQVEHRGKNKIVDIMSPITHGVAEGVTVAEEDSQDDCEDDHSIEERDEDKVEAEAEAVAEAEAEAGPDISSEAGDDTCTGDQGTLENHHITSQETNQDIEYKADQEEGEKTCVEANCDGDKKCEEDDDHSHLAIEDGAIPTPNITRDVQEPSQRMFKGPLPSTTTATNSSSLPAPQKPTGSCSSASATRYGPRDLPNRHIYCISRTHTLLHNIINIINIIYIILKVYGR